MATNKQKFEFGSEPVLVQQVTWSETMCSEWQMIHFECDYTAPREQTKRAWLRKHSPWVGRLTIHSSHLYQNHINFHCTYVLSCRCMFQTSKSYAFDAFLLSLLTLQHIVEDIYFNFKNRSIISIISRWGFHRVFSTYTNTWDKNTASHTVQKGQRKTYNRKENKCSTQHRFIHIQCIKVLCIQSTWRSLQLLRKEKWMATRAHFA